MVVAERLLSCLSAIHGILHASCSHDVCPEFAPAKSVTPRVVIANSRQSSC